MPIDDKLQQIAGSLEQQGKNPTEILDLIKSSKNYSDIGMKIDSLRSSGMKDDQIYGFLKTAKRSSDSGLPGSAGRGYGEKIRSAFHPAQTPEEQAALMKQGREETEAAQGAIRQGVINFFPNLGKTVWNLAKNLVYNPVAESVEQKSLKPLVNTAGSVAVGAVALPVGAAEKLIDKYGGETGSKFVDWLGRGALDNFWQPFENQLKQKYGSPAKFREAIATRPAEVMMDVSMVLGLAGGAAKLAGRGEKAAAARESFAGKPYTRETFEAMAKPEPAPSIAYRDLKRLSVKVPPESTGGLLAAGDALSEASRITNPLNIAQQGIGLLTRPLGAVLKKGEATRALAESKGIPTTVGEDVGSPYLQRAETLAERVPLVGMSGFREKQLAAADAAAKSFLGNYIANPQKPDFWGNKEFYDRLYQEVEDTAKKIPIKTTATETLSATKDLLERYPKVFEAIQDMKTKKLLQKIGQDITKTTKEAPTVLTDYEKQVAQELRDIVQSTEAGGTVLPNGTRAASGLPKHLRDMGITRTGPGNTLEILDKAIEGRPLNTLQFQKVQDLVNYHIGAMGYEETIPEALRGGGGISFNDLWQLRKGIGDAKDHALSQNNMEAVGVLGQVKKAVDKDIDQISETSKTGISEKLRTANEAYKRYNVKYQMLQEAYDKAAGVKGSKEFFSPKTFSTQLKNIIYEQKQGKLFSPSEVDEMAGMANIMQVVKRAGQFAENPPTGNRMIDAMLTGGGIGGMIVNAPVTLKTAIGLGTTTALFRFLTSNPKGKSILRAAGKMEPLDPRMGDILNYVYQVSQAVNNQQPRSQGLTDKEQEKKNLFQPSQLSPEGTQVSNLIDHFEKATPEDRQSMRLDISKRIRNLRDIPKEERQNLINRWNALKETHDEILNRLDTLQ